MELDQVIINVKDGGLGNVAPAADGMAGLIVSVNEDFVGQDPIKVFGPKDARAQLAQFGVAEDSMYGHALWAHIDDFYEQAGAGAPLWLFLTSGILPYVNYFQEGGAADQLLNAALAAGDSIRLLGVALNRPSGLGYIPEDIVSGVDLQLIQALPVAARWAKTKADAYRYCQVLLDGGKLGDPDNLDPTLWATSALDLRYTFTPVADQDPRYLNVVCETSKRVRDVTAGTEQMTNAVGLMLGRLAGSAISDDTSMVSAGPASSEPMYIGYDYTFGTQVSASAYSEQQLSNLLQKGYCVVRAFPTRKGWYWAGARTLARPESDYTRTPMVRVVEKARLVAYDKLVERLSAKSPSDATTGKLSKAYAKAVEQDVNNALELALVTPGDATAVRLRIDADNSGGASGAVAATLEIVPLNYNRTITVTLGLTPTLT